MFGTKTGASPNARITNYVGGTTFGGRSLVRIEFSDEASDVTLPEPAVSSRPNTVCWDYPLF